MGQYDSPNFLSLELLAETKQPVVPLNQRDSYSLHEGNETSWKRIDRRSECAFFSTTRLQLFTQDGWATDVSGTIETSLLKTSVSESENSVGVVRLGHQAWT
jgi:hypothetical protein